MPKLTTQIQGGVKDAANLRTVVMFLTLLAGVTFAVRWYAGTDLPGSNKVRMIFGLNA